MIVCAYMKKSEPDNEIVIYQTEDNEIKIDVRLEVDTVWLTQSQLVDLYQTSKSNISEHVKHIYEECELDRNATVRKFRTVATNSKAYDILLIETWFQLSTFVSLNFSVFVLPPPVKTTSKSYSF